MKDCEICTRPAVHTALCCKRRLCEACAIQCDKCGSVLCEDAKDEWLCQCPCKRRRKP